MGYACPICGTPQRDGEHLANHLAFTAMLGDDDHESWLDEHASGWDESTPADLADRVVEHAPETEYEEVFEDTVDRESQHGHGDSQFEDEHGHGPGRTSFDASAARQRGGANLDEEAQQILREAQELTRGMIEEEANADVGDSDTVGGNRTGAESGDSDTVGGNRTVAESGDSDTVGGNRTGADGDDSDTVGGDRTGGESGDTDIVGGNRTGADGDDDEPNE